MDPVQKEETSSFINKNPSEHMKPTSEVDRECNPDRGHWDRKLDFILSLIGYSVGVSNLWRFPYLCLRNGGGAFLVPFFFFLLVTGIPMFYLEVCLGQFSGTSPLFVWKLCPLFKGVGWGSCIVSGITSIYYVAVLAWVMFYLINSFYPTLPWMTCDNWWNTNKCIGPVHGNGTGFNSTLHVTTSDISHHSDNVTVFLGPFIGNLSSRNLSRNGFDDKTATEEFWQYYVLRKSNGLDDVGTIQPHLVGCLFVCWLIIFLCLIKGVKSLGKVVYVTALLPYILLTILLIRGLLLPGATDGIKFYIYPDFSKLTNYSVWIEAALQVFFSLGATWGSVITMASYNKFHNNCFRDCIIVSLADGLTSFYSGFVIFSVVGFMAKEANVSVTEVATEGPGLALVAYPEAITKLPVPQLWAVLFFLMLFSLGLDSQFGMFENLVAGIIDAFPNKLQRYRMFVTGGVTLLYFLLGLPLTLNLMDWFTSAFCLVITGLLESVIIGWIYGVQRFGRDIQLMLGRQPGVIMRFCWCISNPVILVMVFVATLTSYEMPTYDGYRYPAAARGIGFLFSMLPIVPIPVIMVWELSRAKGTLRQRFCQTLRPSKDWKPALRDYHADYTTDNHEFVLPVMAILPCRETK